VEVPAKKPRSKRQDNRPQRADLTVVPVEWADAPVPAEGWRAETVEAWADYWRSEVAGASTSVDVPGLRRLFEMRDLQARAFGMYRESPFVEGSQGQPRPNPAFDDAMRLEAACVRLEDRIGLTPKARANLGIAFGQAQLTAAELNRRAKEQAPSAVDSVEAELLEEFEAG